MVLFPNFKWTNWHIKKEPRPAIGDQMVERMVKTFTISKCTENRIKFVFSMVFILLIVIVVRSSSFRKFRRRISKAFSKKSKKGSRFNAKKRRKGKALR